MNPPARRRRTAPAGDVAPIALQLEDAAKRSERLAMRALIARQCLGDDLEGLVHAIATLGALEAEYEKIPAAIRDQVIASYSLTLRSLGLAGDGLARLGAMLTSLPLGEFAYVLGAIGVALHDGPTDEREQLAAELVAVARGFRRIVARLEKIESFPRAPRSDRAEIAHLATTYDRAIATFKGRRGVHDLTGAELAAYVAIRLSYAFVMRCTRLRRSGSIEDVDDVARALRTILAERDHDLASTDTRRAVVRAFLRAMKVSESIARHALD